MPKLILSSAENFPIFIDARLSNGGIPFMDLSKIEDFPRWLAPGETIEIDVSGFQEILFRRSLKPKDHPLGWEELSDLYRIKLSADVEIVRHSITGR